MDCSSPDSSVHGISQTRTLWWAAMTSHKQDHKVFVHWFPAYFMEHRVLRVRPCCSLCQRPLASEGCMIVPFCLSTQASMASWVASTLLAVVNKAAMMSLQDPAFSSFHLRICPEVELLDPVAAVSFWRSVILFSVGAAPFYILTSSIRGLQFPHIPVNIWFLCFFLW